MLDNLKRVHYALNKSISYNSESVFHHKFLYPNTHNAMSIKISQIKEGR